MSFDAGTCAAAANRIILNADLERLTSFRVFFRLRRYSQTVICDEEITCYLRPLHEPVMNGSLEFGKEEKLLFMLSLLIQRYGQPF